LARRSFLIFSCLVVQITTKIAEVIREKKIIIYNLNRMLGLNAARNLQRDQRKKWKLFRILMRSN